jgi:hypothetical protein
LLIWGALSDERTGLSFTMYNVQYTIYFTVSDLRAGPCIYNPQEQGGPVIPPGTGCTHTHTHARTSHSPLLRPDCLYWPTELRWLLYPLGTDHAQKTQLFYCCEHVCWVSHPSATQPVHWRAGCCLATVYVRTTYKTPLLYCWPRVCLNTFT